MRAKDLPVTTGGTTSDKLMKVNSSGTLENITVANLATLLGVGVATYYEYDALITQTSTNAPVATVGRNTYSGTPVWSRVSASVYRLTLSNAFSGTTTMQYNFGTNAYITTPTLQKISSSVIELVTNTGLDGDILEASINIKTYI